jgi:diphthine-ammonia ligase
MISAGVRAIMVKCASMGLLPRAHLGRTLAELQPHLLALGQRYATNVCGEGGEYETLTLDCPAYKKAIVMYGDGRDPRVLAVGLPLRLCSLLLCCD